MTVLIAELSSDIGPECVGVLAAEDSHLLEKSSTLLPVSAASLEGAFGSLEAVKNSAANSGAHSGALEGLSLPRVPTRLLEPALEIHAPIRKSELWVIREQAFVVAHIHFEQRLEGIEWWERTPVFRDYFRVWLARVGLSDDTSSRCQGQKWGAASRPEKSGGLEALVYRDREQSKTYLQALYD